MHEHLLNTCTITATTSMLSSHHVCNAPMLTSCCHTDVCRVLCGFPLPFHSKTMHVLTRAAPGCTAWPRNSSCCIQIYYAMCILHTCICTYIYIHCMLSMLNEAGADNLVTCKTTWCTHQASCQSLHHNAILHGARHVVISHIQPLPNAKVICKPRLTPALFTARTCAAHKHALWWRLRVKLSAGKTLSPQHTCTPSKAQQATAASELRCALHVYAGSTPTHDMWTGTQHTPHQKSH
jgi:hypothetical protein